MRHHLIHFAPLLAVFLLSSSSSAKPPNVSFRLHVVNAESTYSACAAIDVNQDGKLDIVSGGWWYQAPHWKRHFLREVQEIRGRFDGYSHLPLDVNADGRLDIVSANYRSKSLYWIENRGSSPWKKHLIDQPGPMETGRLHDIDGDGAVDVLPNGVKFAAWWELRRPSPSSNQKPRWIRHDLPPQIAGHGVGFGDINGDGRGDIVSPRGWLEAPADRRRDRWRFHPDFKLHRDGSIPIFVTDVDQDGDGDVVWARGHDIGLYWLEQQANRRWIKHVIDTQWSQAHSLLLADVDNDQHPELIAGKRYMGHDGRDPGEYDPLVAYWYKYDPKSQTWRRHVISGGGPAGFGLDPKAVDLDGDGDLDIIAPGRSGLYWFENLLISRSQAQADRAASAPPYDDHSRLLVYKNEQGQPAPVKSPADWARRRAHVLAHMQTVMGRLPDPSKRVPLNVKVLQQEKLEPYVRQKITFAVEPGDRVFAWLLIPRRLFDPSRGPSSGDQPQTAAAMLCLHQTTRIGKDEPAGLGGKASLHYAHELAKRGYVCLAPDYPSFGEYPYDFRKQGASYASGSMKAVWNNIRALDVLESLPFVHPDRIGCIGHSLGGHNSLFTAVFDQRIRAMVSSCGFTAFHHYYGGKLAGWTSDRYMPKIRDVYGNDPDRVPFDFYEIVGALAPRPFFINAPQHDSNFDIAGVKKVVNEAAGVYELFQAKKNLHAEYPDVGHDFPPSMREKAYQWLDKNL